MRNLVYVSAFVVGAAACGSSLGNRTSTGASGGAPSSSAGSGADGNGGTGSSGSGGSTGALMLGDAGTGSGGPCSAYQSCAVLGDNCGMAPDGCGNLQDCGTCTAPETCGGSGTPNVCGSPVCTKQTCASQSYDCGMASDGCGGTLDCGTCATSETCGAQQANVCGTGVCMAKTCAQQGYDCGMEGDGCGAILDCGTCPATQACGGGVNPKNGVCGTVACVPRTCASQGFNCGMATDACGTIINCGACAASQVCGATMPNVCGSGGGCPVGSNLVYVWDTNNVIHSFDPLAKTFATVATPDCDASSPNSMAIDRNLVAWLNYLSPGFSSPNDYIYKFDLKTGTGCQPSGIPDPGGFSQVGMGFSTDTVGGNTETLYVDGIGGAGLARVDMTSKTIVPIGGFANDVNLEGQSCELTGTGNATLFGYFTTSPYVRIAQLNKTNAYSITDKVLTGFTPPEDWAFSFFGGDFYMYAYPNASNSPNSSVIHYAPGTNTLDLAYIPNVGFTIGAGVSTCAQTTSCTPRTCAQANAQCGPAGDGCGNILMCGVCATGQVCVGGACTSGCTPKTCASQGFTCGMQGDGCGDALQCGVCPSGLGCSGGACSNGTCTPKTCAQQGYACGTFGDGCGNLINCGTCPAGEICGGATPGQCEKPACTPKTCTQLGFNCGEATDGCGNIINCGSCSGAQSCGGAGSPNVCGGTM